jgi:hypothetical protein
VLSLPTAHSASRFGLQLDRKKPVIFRQCRSNDWAKVYDDFEDETSSSPDWIERMEYPLWRTSLSTSTSQSLLGSRLVNNELEEAS